MVGRGHLEASTQQLKQFFQENAKENTVSIRDNARRYAMELEHIVHEKLSDSESNIRVG